MHSMKCELCMRATRLQQTYRGLCVCLSGTRVSAAEAAGPIVDSCGPKNHELDAWVILAPPGKYH